MVLRYSEEEALRIIEEQKAKRQRVSEGHKYKPDEGLESVLSNKVRGYCKQKGYPALIFKQSKLVKTLVTAGWPDGVIALPRGRVLWVELKNKEGRLKPDQHKYRLMLLALGHHWYEVRSFKQFIDIVEGIINA